MMVFDPSDRKFKLYAVNVRSTEYAGKRGEQYADTLMGRNKWENGDEVDQWLKKNKLDGSKTFNTTYDLLNDPYFPQPPIRRPDNPSDLGPYTSIIGNCPKADIPPQGLTKNNTFIIQNNLKKSSVFISINCNLYGIKIKFQQDISKEPELKTAMPEGIHLESVDLIINGSCHHHKLESSNIQNIGINLL